MASPVEPDPQRGAPAVMAGWAAAAAGAGGFVAGGGLCLAACYGLLYLYVSGLPRRSEVNDALADVPAVYGGACLAIVLSLAAGVVSGAWAARRVGRRGQASRPNHPLQPAPGA